MPSSTRTERDPLQLAGFLSRPIRYSCQWIQNWRVRNFYPACKDAVVARIRERLAIGGTVTSGCRCGACKLVAEDAPRLVTVCHCSVCRNDEAKAIGADNAPAPSFAAVRRSTCRLEVNMDVVIKWQPELNSDTALYRQSALVFRNSSDFARRGRCALCDSSLVMDYEWLEPETVWLVNPTWVYTGQDGREVVEQIEKGFSLNGGLADIDVCWNSRGDPCTSTTKVSYLGKEDVREEFVDRGNKMVKQRGVVKCQDLEWAEYKLDAGEVTFSPHSSVLNCKICKLK